MLTHSYTPGSSCVVFTARVGIALGVYSPCWMASPKWPETLAMCNALSSVLTQSLRNDMGTFHRRISK